jgi:hypothetical protein
MSATSSAVSVPLAPRRWWSNPIFRRYARSRLRPQALFASLLVVGIIAAFIYFAARTGFRYQGGMTPADAERTALPGLLVFQSIILFLMGTGTVAAGMTGEADEGTLDYQRLSPMTPLSKALGYLTGLPIREWCLFGITLPFTAWALWKGEVPASAWMPIYAAMLSSALLYHLTGLVAGTVLKNRRWAFLASIGVIFLLYTVLPQAAKFGLVYFKYMTIWPVIDENIANLMPREAGGVMRFAKSMEPDVRFFGLRFSEIAFTLFSQGFLILTFIVMLWRRWRRVESHLLGKIWALGLFAWLQLMLLGNALPLIEPGLLFPSRQFSRFFRDVDWRPNIGEAVAMIGIYGVVTLALLVVLTLIITPTTERQMLGLQRARKLGLKRSPYFSDPSSSFGMVLVMAAVGAVGWTIFAQQLIASDWFPGYQLAWYAGATFALVLLSAGLICQAILEGWGGPRFFLACVFGAVLPLLVGGVIGSINNRSLTAATWLVGISPVAAPAYAASVLIPTVDFPRDVSRALPRAFWFWQALTAFAAVWFSLRLRGLWRQRRALVYQDGAATGQAAVDGPGGTGSLG